MKIGFIGAGNMANAIINGILSSKFISAENIAVTDIDENKLIDKESYLNEKMKLLTQRFEVQSSQIADYTASYKLNVMSKYENEIGKI